MADRPDLERRVAELEAEVARLRSVPRGLFRGVRYRSALTLGDIPVLAIATGPDPDKGEFRGHARGIVAIGDMATGSSPSADWPAASSPWAAWPWA